MKLKEIRRGFLRFVGNHSISFMLSLLCRTLKIDIKNGDVINDLEQKGTNYILAFWHDTMLIPWYLHRNKNLAGLTSKSKDGDLLAKTLKRWNYKVIRGSSSTGGDVALGVIVDYAQNGYSIGITPDGPRGPVHMMKAGAVVAAKKSGVPLILVGIGLKKKKYLRSWDKFQIPKFFTQVNAIYSDRIYIEKHLNYDETNLIIKECEEELNKLQVEAELF